MGTGDEALEILRTVLATDLPVLVDADGLTVLAENLDLVRDRQAPTLLTPTPASSPGCRGRRWATTGRPRCVRWPPNWARRCCSRAGSPSSPPRRTGVRQRCGIVVGGHGRRGDVLTGIAGSLLAAGLEPVVAGACAARVHALAARQASGGAPVGASALLAAVHPVIGELRGA